MAADIPITDPAMEVKQQQQQQQQQWKAAFDATHDLLCSRLTDKTQMCII
ncbi:Hypothetical predicted protein [Pelobates cultripes]|uniref:Uncharacterized protein n=1 Tax=Pelobates cultripes TaxID=61616 RepID=A0AAD1T3T5_PELCU|nr:Hypothetical predicted protein [Pelobates cultripes]